MRAALAAAALVAMVGSPAVAVAEVEPLSSSQCGSGGFCIWSGVGYTGSFSARTSDGTLGFTSAKSYWNRSSKAVRVYVSTSGSGTSTCIPAGLSQSSTALTVGYLDFLTTATC